MRTKTVAVVPGRDVDVFGLDASATLGFVIDRRRAQDAEAAAEMAAVTHWADLHRTDSVIGAAIDLDIAKSLPKPTPTAPTNAADPPASSGPHRTDVATASTTPAPST